MKKMTKALAVLTVLAMLATLFVAVPASATDYTGLTPAVDLIFTEGNTPDSNVVDPSDVAVNTVFYAWVHYTGFAPGAYVWMSNNAVTYDSTVEKPYNLKGKKAATSNTTAKNAFAEADLLMYSEDDAIGYYQSGAQADFANSYLSCSINAHTDLMTIINGGGWEDIPNDGITEDSFFQIPASGEFVSNGYAFIKTAAGASGVTIAGNNKVLNGKDVYYKNEVLPDAAFVRLVDHQYSYREVDGATSTGYDYEGVGSGKITDNSPVDGGEEPTQPPISGEQVTGDKQDSKSATFPNAFFYEFVTPVIPGEITGLTATFAIPGKAAVAGHVSADLDLVGMSNLAINLAAVVKNVPDGQEDVQVTTNYVLSYIEEGVTKTLEWSRTDSLN